VGLRADQCTEDTIDKLLAELQRLAATDPAAAQVYARARAHVDQLRTPWDATWTIQAIDGVIRQMNQGGFRSVVGRVVGGSACIPAQMASFRLESLTDKPVY
jgi:hypothetical protein